LFPPPPGVEVFVADGGELGEDDAELRGRAPDDGGPDKAGVERTVPEVPHGPAEKNSPFLSPLSFFRGGEKPKQHQRRRQESASSWGPTTTASPPGLPAPWVTSRRRTSRGPAPRAASAARRRRRRRRRRSCRTRRRRRLRPRPHRRPRRRPRCEESFGMDQKARNKRERGRY